MASMNRWNRSRSLSITMSNGVVVVPSSLYPRTYRPRVIRVRLGRMTDTEIAGLVEGAMPAGAGPDQVAAVVAAADGNPLYARELAYADPGAAPASITDAVLTRAAALAAPARAVVDQVSVADGGMSHDLLAATVRLPEKRLLAAARAAVESGLLTAAGDGYSFPHALIRQIIYAQILPGERQHLHRGLAEALAGRPGSDPGLLARHWQRGGSPDRAAAAAVLAARHAVSVRAYPEAQQNYALAIELSAWLPEAGPALLDEAALAASWAGDPGQAAAWGTEAVARSDAAAPLDRARRLERLGHYRWQTGDPKAALEITEQAMEILDLEPPSRLRPGSWPRWPPAGCCSASRPPRGRWPSARCRWPSAPARTPRTRTAWPRWASSRRSTATWRVAWPTFSRRSRSRAASAASRTSSAPPLTSCTC
jgi:hypothetical protein